MKLLTFADLREQPRLEWLVEGLIPRESMCMLYAPSGVGKSFLALDLAHSIASGRPWLGYTVHQAPALYVIAEGLAGFPTRAVGWCQAHARDDPGPMLYAPEPVRFHEPARVAELVTALATAHHEPALMVVDTLHASLGGGSESDSQDMGILLDGVRTVQRTTGCASLLVHHTGWDTSRLRGSSSIYAAMDVVLALKPLGGGNLELRVEKPRDFAAPAPITLRLRTAGETAVPELVTTIRGTLTPPQRAILAVFGDDDSKSLTNKDLLDHSGLGPATYYRTKKDLLDEMGAIERDGKRFRLSDLGRSLLTDTTSNSYHYHDAITDSHDSGTPALSLTPPSKGVRVIVSAESGNGRKNGNGTHTAPIVAGREVSYPPGSPEEADFLAALAARQGGA